MVAAIDWGNAIPVLFVVIIGVLRFLSELRAAGRPKPMPLPKPMPAPLPAPRQRGPAPPAPAAGDPSDRLRREVEDFLRGRGAAPANAPSKGPTKAPKKPLTKSPSKSSPVRPEAPAELSGLAHLGKLDHRSTIAEHEVGSIAHAGGPPSATGPEGLAEPLASQLASALTNPASVRQAVILGEVLQRPTHRW